MAEPASDRPMTVPVALLWTIALWVVESVCVSVTEEARPGAHLDLVNLAACQILATSAVLFAIVRVHAPEASLRATLGMRPIAVLHLVLSVAAGAGLAPLLSTLDAAILSRWPYDPEVLAVNDELMSVTTLRARILLVVVGTLIVPVVRELFFRGALFGGLRRATSGPVAAVTTAVFFACFPVELREIPSRLVLALALAVLRVRAGTVLAAMVAHIAFWSLDGILILAGHDPTADVAYPLRWIVGGAVIAVLALAAIGAGRRKTA